MLLLLYYLIYTLSEDVQRIWAANPDLIPIQ
ncbi:unnamed protein product, partial [Acanthocheilonema viteae]